MVGLWIILPLLFCIFQFSKMRYPSVTRKKKYCLKNVNSMPINYRWKNLGGQAWFKEVYLFRVYNFYSLFTIQTILKLTELKK